MNRYSQHLTYTLLGTLFGVPLGSIVAGLLLGIYGLVVDPGQMGQIGKAMSFGFSIALFGAFVGMLPALIYGAPLYAWFSSKNCANVLVALSIGALPSLFVFSAEPHLGIPVFVFGTCVSLATHLLVRQRLAELRQSGDGSSVRR